MHCPFDQIAYFYEYRVSDYKNDWITVKCDKYDNWEVQKRRINILLLKAEWRKRILRYFKTGVCPCNGKSPLNDDATAHVCIFNPKIPEDCPLIQERMDMNSFNKGLTMDLINEFLRLEEE